jgi:site-specific recombinase XerC
MTSFLQSAGVGQAVSQEIVGHESEAIHAIYTRINRDTLQHAIDLLPDVTARAKA